MIRNDDKRAEGSKLVVNHNIEGLSMDEHNVHVQSKNSSTINTSNVNLTKINDINIRSASSSASASVTTSTIGQSEVSSTRIGRKKKKRTLRIDENDCHNWTQKQVLI